MGNADNKVGGERHLGNVENKWRDILYCPERRKKHERKINKTQKAKTRK